MVPELPLGVPPVTYKHYGAPTLQLYGVKKNQLLLGATTSVAFAEGHEFDILDAGGSETLAATGYVYDLAKSKFEDNTVTAFCKWNGQGEPTCVQSAPEISWQGFRQISAMEFALTGRWKNAGDTESETVIQHATQTAAGLILADPVTVTVGPGSWFAKYEAGGEPKGAFLLYGDSPNTKNHQARVAKATNDGIVLWNTGLTAVVGPTSTKFCKPWANAMPPLVLAICTAPYPVSGHIAVGLNSDTGAVLWHTFVKTDDYRLLQGAMPAAPGVAGLWFSRFVNTASPIGPAASVVYLDNTGRIVGQTATAELPNNDRLTDLVPDTDPNLLWWRGNTTTGACHAHLGLADTWANFTCATSGPCWQKIYADCADTNPCISDLCDAAHNGCFHVPLPDDTTCATGKACKSGNCQ